MPITHTSLWLSLYETWWPMWHFHDNDHRLRPSQPQGFILAGSNLSGWLHPRSQLHRPTRPALFLLLSVPCSVPWVRPTLYSLKIVARCFLILESGQLMHGDNHTQDCVNMWQNRDGIIPSECCNVMSLWSSNFIDTSYLHDAILCMDGHQARYRARPIINPNLKP